jgi:hypothetical protein
MKGEGRKGGEREGKNYIGGLQKRRGKGDWEGK